MDTHRHTHENLLFILYLYGNTKSQCKFNVTGMDFLESVQNIFVTICSIEKQTEN